MSETKEEILKTALRLFAQNGYEATSVSQIAGALGMSKGALYKHYKNKRDIFEQILHKMEDNDANQANDYSVPTGTIEESPEKYAATTLDDMLSFSLAMLHYWCEDEFAANFRRMLTVEQYHTSEMHRLYQQYLASGPLAYVEDVFREIGVDNPAKHAIDCYAPMFLAYSLYDGTADRAATLKETEEYLCQIYAELKNSLRF